MALMEAVAGGVSVVATVHSGILELITYEVSGLLANEQDASSLAAQLERMMTDEDNGLKMLRCTRNHVADHFNKKKLKRQLAAFVRDRFEQS